MSDSPRRVVMDTLRRLCEEVRGGVYFVKRGPIDWATFPFDSHPRAISILADDLSLFKELNEASLTLEIAAQIRTQGEDPGLDDGLMDEFIDDAEWVVRSLIGKDNASGDAVVLKTDLEDSRAIEFHDPQLKVQGIIVNFDVSY